MNNIIAGEYVFNISDQTCHQAFNIRTQTLHSAHVLPETEQSKSVLIKLSEANEKLTNEEGHLKIQNMFLCDGNYYVVYENLTKDATNLLDIMKARNNLPENFVRKVAQLLLAHVNNMHNLNIIHRDLKLPNIYMYKQSNGQWNLKVKDLRYSEIDSKTAIFNDHKGSPAYLAPEVTFSGQSYNAFSAEIYSVGVILYTLATGTYPFVGSCPKSLIQAIRTSPLTFPQSMSSSLRSLLENMLNKNPNERMKAQELLKHPWVSGAESQASSTTVAAPSTTTTTTTTVGTSPSASFDQQVPHLVQSCMHASSSAGNANFFGYPAKPAAVY